MRLTTLTYSAIMAGIGLSILSHLPSRVSKSKSEKYPVKTNLLDLIVDVEIITGQKRSVIKAELSNADPLHELGPDWLEVERDLGFQLQNYTVITRGVVLKELNFLSSISKLKFKVLDND